MPTGNDIKAARELLKESQEAFARRLGVDQATIHRWETRGLPSSGTARVAVENLLDDLLKPKPDEAVSA